MKPLQELTRPNIWSLAPYSSARNEYAGREARVFLDANENPYNAPYNRYPDPLQLELKAALSKVKDRKIDNQLRLAGHAWAFATGCVRLPLSRRRVEKDLLCASRLARLAMECADSPRNLLPKRGFQ